MGRGRSRSPRLLPGGVGAGGAGAAAGCRGTGRGAAAGRGAGGRGRRCAGARRFKADRGICFFPPGGSAAGAWLRFIQTSGGDAGRGAESGAPGSLQPRRAHPRAGGAWQLRSGRQCALPATLGRLAPLRCEPCGSACLPGALRRVEVTERKGIKACRSSDVR